MMGPKELLKRKRKVFHRRTPPGEAPGTILVDPESPFPKIRVFSYGADDVEERDGATVAEVRALVGRRPVTWVNVDGLGDAETLKQLAIAFDLHRLSMEDVVNVHQRAKVEAYPGNLFIVARMVTRIHDTLGTEQLTMFLGKGFLLTFQERPGDCLDSLRDRIRSNKGRARRGGADYLAYAVLDAVVDAYFPVLEEMGERLEDLEDRIAESPDRETVSVIHQVKRDLLVLRKAMWPLRETVNTLQREDPSVIAPETALYLRDCYDHVIQVIDMLENYRDLAASLMDFYMSAVSNRMNEVMKVLTVIATIFIPLTFIAGIYGMNFNPDSSPLNMPELNWYWGYPMFWGIIAVVGVGLAVFFKRRGWL